jgi:MFS family permease
MLHLNSPSRASEIETNYGWWMAFITLLITSISFGAVTSIPILIKPMAMDWNVGLGDLSLVHMSTMFGAGLGSLLLGRLFDRYGFFHIAVAGAVSTAVGLVMAATATHLFTFYLAFGLLVGGVGQGAFFSPITAALSQWFDRHQGLAIAIAASGQSVGGLFLPPLLRWGAEQAGWRATLAIYGVVAGLILIICVLVFRRRPPPTPSVSRSSVQPLTIKNPIRSWFFLLGLSMALSNLSMFVVMGHLTAYGEEQGFAPFAAAALLSMMMGITLFSRLSAGYISGRWGAYRVAVLMSALHVFGAACLATSQSYAAIAASVVLMGLGFGGYIPAYAILVRKMFPAQESGRRIAEIYFFGFMAAGIGSSLGGWLRDLDNDYSRTFFVATIAALIGWSVLISLRKSLARL